MTPLAQIACLTRIENSRGDSPDQQMGETPNREDITINAITTVSVRSANGQCGPSQSTRGIETFMLRWGDKGAVPGRQPPTVLDTEKGAGMG